MVHEAERVTVYLAANKASGLYYAFLTFEQLLSSHSTEDTVVLPHVSILDWPHIRLRGSWTVLSHFGKDERALEQYDGILRNYSKWKLNMAEAWHLFTDKLSPEGKVDAYWVYPKEVIKVGERYAVKVFPGTGHITGRLGPPEMKKRFPHVAGTPKTPERKIVSLCQSHPDTRQMLEEYLVSIARQFDFADIWMTELEGPRGVCHCDRCKGILKDAFVKETQHLMHAYSEAKKVNPAFRIILGLTQGSYPHNLAMLEYIPKDVTLNFYNGKMTYRADFRRYNLPPSATEMQRQGYTVGSCPSPSETYVLFPFQTPQYCRLLCGEAEDRNLDFVMAQMFPDPFVHDFNSQACAEFLWNSSGRSADEFTTAWATRRNFKDPNEVAAIISMVEYASRGLHNNKVSDMIEAIVRFVNGRDRASSRAYLRYEFATYAEMARIRKLCEEATSRAKRLGNPELHASCEVLERWISIIERYARCVVNSKDAKVTQAAKEDIRSEVRELRASRDRWIAFKKDELRRCRRQDFLDRFFDSIMKSWDPIFGEERARDSSELAELMMAKEIGTLEILPLENQWKFKTAAGKDPDPKLLSPDTDDSKWPAVASDKGCGYEKQGFEGYTGHAWYRQTLRVPANLSGRRHHYLVFLAVDEDAEVYINGKKAFDHSHKTVGGLPGATWDKPFSFDARRFLQPGKKNLIATRVFNRAGMGGIWKPVFLVASDKKVGTSALVQLVVSSDE